MMRTKSASVSGLSSTRIGKRPCSSGMRSLGLETWKAPAAMKSTWSVFTIPYLVCTFDPSTIGSRSRCTPSRETSGPPISPRSPAILSISSRKMMPSVSTRVERLADDVVEVDQLVELLVEQDAARLDHLAPCACFFFLGSMLARASRRSCPSPRGAPCWPITSSIGDALRHLDLDLALVELAVLEQLPELLARALVAFARELLVLRDAALRGATKTCWRVGPAVRRRASARPAREQEVEQALVHPLVGEVLDVRSRSVRTMSIALLHEIAHHRLRRRAPRSRPR